MGEIVVRCGNFNFTQHFCGNLSGFFDSLFEAQLNFTLCYIGIYL